MEKEFAVILKDPAGNILVNKDGYVTCTCEGGLQLQILYKEIDFSRDTLEFTMDNRTIYIKLHEVTHSAPSDENTLSLVTQNENNVIQEHDNDNTFGWSDASTKLFISIYKEKIDLLINRKIKTRKVLWEKIRQIMQSHGYNATATQIENKYKSLERAFKNMVTNNKQTGRGRVTCPYQTELTELLGSKHNVEPLAVSGREGLVIREDVRASTSLSTLDLNNENNENIQNTQENIQNTQENIQNIQENIQNTQEENNTIETMMLRDTTQNNSSEILQNRKRKKMGNTARMIEKCQDSIEKFLNNASEEKENKLEIQRSILTEYKQLRICYEESLKKIQEQLEIANQHREEKNNLLKQLILMKKK